MLITGASSGIGLQTLLKSIDKGIFPIAACRNKDLLHENLSKVDISPKDYGYVYLDLESDISVQNIIKEVKKITKTLDHLVLNAGFIDTSPVLMTSLNSIQRHLNINFISQILIAQSITKSFFIKRKRGTIVAVSSSAAIDANEARMAYAASKAAFSTAIRVLSKELGKINIRANVIAPGLTETKLMRNSTEPEQIKNFVENLSLKKVADPREVSDLIHFLSSEESSYITGQVISIDGGIR